MKRFLLLFILLAPPAQALKSEKTIWLGLGLINHEMGRLSGSASGAPSLFGSLYLDLAVTGKFRIIPSWYLSPFLAYTPLGSKGADLNQKSYLMPIALTRKAPQTLRTSCRSRSFNL